MKIRDVTIQQKRILDQAIKIYGKPDRVMVNTLTANREIKGRLILRADWCEKDKHVFILPSGERLDWLLIDGKLG